MVDLLIGGLNNWAGEKGLIRQVLIGKGLIGQVLIGKGLIGQVLITPGSNNLPGEIFEGFSTANTLLGNFLLL